MGNNQIIDSKKRHIAELEQLKDRSVAQAIAENKSKVVIPKIQEFDNETNAKIQSIREELKNDIQYAEKTAMEQIETLKSENAKRKILFEETENSTISNIVSNEFDNEIKSESETLKKLEQLGV